MNKKLQHAKKYAALYIGAGLLVMGLSVPGYFMYKADALRDNYNKSSRKFYDRDVVDFYNNNISPDTVIAYLTNKAENILELSKMGITPTKERQLLSRTGSLDSKTQAKINEEDGSIILILESNHSVKEIKCIDTLFKFDARYPYGDIYAVSQYPNGIPSIMNRFDAAFKRYDIIDCLVPGGVTPEYANAFVHQGKQSFYGEEIPILYKNNRVTSDYAESFIMHGKRRFSVNDIANFYNNKKERINSSQAHSYGTSFNGAEICTLINGRIDADDANRYDALNNKYGSHISASSILYYKKIGMSYEEVELRTIDTMVGKTIVK